MMKEKVILVDDNDTVIGEQEKLEAHLKGNLHRAISIIIFNSEGKMLLQQRAFSKYHTPGLWTNACCSHPRPGEQALRAAKRRLMEEMGLTTSLEEKFSFVYRAQFDNGLTEHEFDHVFFGITDSDPDINRDEANDFRWIALPELMNDLSLNPESYTIWFRIILKEITSRYPELLPTK